MKQAIANVARVSALLCAAALISASLTGCKGTAPPLTEAEKQNWKGTAPPPGFEAEMAKQNREWQERQAQIAARVGKKAATPPPGVTVK